MTKNIKEIGKELLGKSLNSFHRKTGLIQLEKNNEMQDGILDGILSQVDDAYIEKTEQSNVIHLEGSGDGVVVLDSIEGNTIINNIKDFTPVNIVSDNIQSIFNNGVLTYKAINNYEGALHKSNILKIHLNHSLKDNTVYTFVVNCNDNCNVRFMSYDGTQVSTTIELTKGLNKKTFTKNTLENTDFHFRIETNPNNCREFIYSGFMIIEGNCIDNEINYSEGLQSSFEEKVNDEGKYEIEILSRNEDETKSNKIKVLLNEPLRAIGDVKDRLCINNGKLAVERYCDVREYQEGDLDLENVLTDMTNTIYLLDEIFYEEVTNEYGELIILEGYENGTLYIDSTIVPTTTVRYTPKMESFKILKEVENNNIMLANDVNDNIIPYMMDVDLMIMEKEMALMSHKNIRKMEVLDMTSMQKRTQEMLERLIKGKTLTEQECKTRVTTYLNAGKITDEQAEELMLLIDEVYA